VVAIAGFFYKTTIMQSFVGFISRHLLTDLLSLSMDKRFFTPWRVSHSSEISSFGATRTLRRDIAGILDADDSIEMDLMNESLPMFEV
jgi:hypothetical protein